MKKIKNQKYLKKNILILVEKLRYWEKVKNLLKINKYCYDNKNIGKKWKKN